MKISIVIPAFNEEKLLAETLRAVESAAAAFTAAGWAREIIVCDNNSTDRTAELARAAGATVVFEPVNQIARARNTGAAAATGDWLLFVDADSRPSRELCADVVAEIQRGRCLAGGSTVQLDERHFAADFVVGFWNCVSRAQRLLAGSFIFCEAAAFRELGGFSAELFAGEELDLSQRLKALAKSRGREVVILHRHPLLTSARKVRLYSKREHLRLMARAVFSRGAALKKRDECAIWYDGRR
ncbi:MAG: glycosyltransferase [Verrucomicrobia bacterium]|nr:glycosyltransferase [Verrucomicrobiota bacterium]